MYILIYGVSEKEIHIFSRLVLLPQVKTFGDFPWTKREELSFSLHNNMTAWGEGKKSKAPIARQEMLHFSLFLWLYDVCADQRSKDTQQQWLLFSAMVLLNWSCVRVYVNVLIFPSLLKSFPLIRYPTVTLQWRDVQYCRNFFIILKAGSFCYYKMDLVDS